MGIRLTHVGFGNYLAPGRIVAVGTPGSAPVKRRIQTAREKDEIIDFTNGRRTKSVIFTDCGFLVLSSLAPATIDERQVNAEKETNEA